MSTAAEKIREGAAEQIKQIRVRVRDLVFELSRILKEGINLCAQRHNFVSL